MTLARLTVTLFLLQVTTALPHRTSAQVLGDYPIVAASLPADCEAVVDLVGVDSHFRTTGIYDFWIYPIHLSSYGGIDAVRFSILWPLEWHLEEAELCGGTEILEGSIGTPGAGVTLGIDYVEWPPRPAVRLRIDASSPGALGLGVHPVYGDLGFRTVNDASWHPYWPEWRYPVAGDLSPYYVVIGEAGPCSQPPPYPYLPGFCLFWSWRPPGRLLMPDVIHVPAGRAFIDTVAVESVGCVDASIPECLLGYPPGPPCLGVVESQTSWLSFGELSWEETPGIAVHGRLEMRIDAAELPPGEHEARAYLIGGPCASCFTWCKRFVVSVSPMTVEPSTWGRIKASYRD